MTLTLLEDRLNVLRECGAIEHDLAKFEQQHGPTAEAEDLRRRLQVARLQVLGQLAVPLAMTTPTIH
jgi:hypothetical protein